MAPKWSTPEIDDREFYTGYGFAVVNKRANRSVVLGKNYLRTDATDKLIDSANRAGEKIVHPYLDIIRSSVDFSERDFWYDISTYLDLEGVYYLMAVRAVAGERVGNVTKFVLLNPYNVKAIVNDKGELGGYVEQRGDKQRQIPKEMIIPIRLLNPFDPDKAYSLADAARDSQYTLKQANDYAREAIDGNLNSPGILSSAIELPDDQFDNFVERVKNHGRGEPLFGNGSGTVTWVDMQTDLDKAALADINSINRDTLLAISGLSKTGVGVEESGTGREVSRTQKDDFTENAVMPQIENIIDALNLDYRKYYGDDWQRNRYMIQLDNPLETNKDAEQADVDIRASQFDLMQALASKGYDYSLAAKYAKGLIDITDLGEPEEPEQPSEVIEVEKTEDAGEDQPPKDTPKETNNSFELEGSPIPVVQYLGDQAEYFIPSTEEKSTVFSNIETDMVRIQSVAEVDGYIVATTDTGSIKLGQLNAAADAPSVVAKLSKRYKNQPVAVKKKINSYNSEDLLVAFETAEEKIFQAQLEDRDLDLEDLINDLTVPLVVYFTVMFPAYAHQRAQQTASKLGINDPMPVTILTDEMKSKINNFSRREAESHVSTIQMDITTALAKIKVQTSDRDEQKQLLSLAFADIQKRRAYTISDNASRRIYQASFYEADRQLLTRAGLLESAYKVLESSTGDPCSVCEQIINEGPIPFEDDFVKFGETIKTADQKMTFDFETIEAGNIHVNCNCFYTIILQ